MKVQEFKPSSFQNMRVFVPQVLRHFFARVFVCVRVCVCGVFRCGSAASHTKLAVATVPIHSFFSRQKNEKQARQGQSETLLFDSLILLFRVYFELEEDC
jgi:hypothetical protein